jgi:hypothetical protein
VEKSIEHNCISYQTNTRLNSFLLYNKDTSRVKMNPSVPIHLKIEMPKPNQRMELAFLL